MYISIALQSGRSGTRPDPRNGLEKGYDGTRIFQEGKAQNGIGGPSHIALKAYSIDLRKRVLEAYLNGEGSQRVLAARFKVSVDFVRRLLKKYRETGELAPGEAGGGQQPLVDSGGLAVVRLLMAAQPAATLAELCALYEGETGTSVSVATMCRVRQRLKKLEGQADADDPQGDGAAKEVLVAMPGTGRNNGRGTLKGVDQEVRADS